MAVIVSIDIDEGKGVNNIPSNSYNSNDPGCGSINQDQGFYDSNGPSTGTQPEKGSLVYYHSGYHPYASSGIMGVDDQCVGQQHYSSFSGYLQSAGYSWESLNTVYVNGKSGLHYNGLARFPNARLIKSLNTVPDLHSDFSADLLRRYPPVGKLTHIRQKCGSSSSTEQSGKEAREQEGKWTELPKDMGFEIIRRLGAADEVKFSVVCKQWKQLNESAGHKIFPMLISNAGCYFNMDNYKFYDPVMQEVFEIRNEIKDRRSFHFWRVQKHWMLLGSIRPTRFHFYNPFLKKVIHVPQFWGPIFEPTNFLATFGIRDSFFLFLVQDISVKKGNGLLIRVWVSGGETRVTRVENYSIYDVHQLVTSRDSLFVFFKHGVVGVLHGNDWTIVKDDSISAVTTSLLIDRNTQVDFMECEGDIYLVQSHGWREDSIRWKVLKLDLAEKQWYEEKFESGNNVIFMPHCTHGFGSFTLPPLMIRVNKENQELCGRIYYCKGSDPNSCYYFHPLLGDIPAFQWPHQPTFKIWIETPLDYYTKNEGSYYTRQKKGG